MKTLNRHYKFSILELASDFERFSILHPYDKTIEDIVEEAAKLFYYGKCGWEEAWPLTFVIHTLDDNFLVKASVFILYDTPTFDVIILKVATR
jgi:hypothetical protein